MEFCNSPSLSDIRTVKEASAVCRSFLDGVVIFLYSTLWQFTDYYSSVFDVWSCNVQFGNIGFCRVHFGREGYLTV